MNENNEGTTTTTKTARTPRGPAPGPRLNCRKAMVELTPQALNARFAESLVRLGVDAKLTIAQARCLRGLERAPLLGVPNGSRGWRAPDTAMSHLITYTLAHYVPPVVPGSAPTYAITMSGREVVAVLMGDEVTRALVDVAVPLPSCSAALTSAALVQTEHEVILTTGSLFVLLKLAALPSMRAQRVKLMESKWPIVLREDVQALVLRGLVRCDGVWLVLEPRGNELVKGMLEMARGAGADGGTEN